MSDVLKECCEFLMSKYTEQSMVKSNNHIDVILDSFQNDVYKCVIYKTEVEPSEELKKSILINIINYRKNLKNKLEELRKD